MIIWLFRQISTLRKALAGRDRPEELAWAVAFGLMLGLIPKGNLVAVGLICFVLTLRINHAMAAITAVAVSFAALFVDPFAHNVGSMILEQPSFQEFFTWSWQQPIVPWTDLNNTVVVGSLVIGMIALLPAYSMSLPLFKSIAPKPDVTPPRDSDSGRIPVDAMQIAPREVSRPVRDDDVSEPQEAAEHRTQIDVIRIRRPNEDWDSHRRDEDQDNNQEKAA